jgi:uncharacterized protein YacL
MFKALAAGLTWTTPNTGVNASNLNDPGQIAQLVVNILVWAIGVIAVAFIIVGGIKYATSGGDEKKVASAKNTILYAVIGLVVALLANVIIRLVLNALGITGSVF